MNDTPTPETPIQILQNGQGRFRSDIEELFEKRSLEVLRAVNQVIQNHVALKKELTAVTEQRDEMAEFCDWMTPKQATPEEGEWVLHTYAGVRVPDYDCEDTHS